MPQQVHQAAQAYDSDANFEARTDDEQEHQEPSPTKSRVSICKLAQFSSTPSEHESSIMSAETKAITCMLILWLALLQVSKIRSFRIRTVSTFVLIGSFLGFIWAGHVPLMFMIFCIQVM